ncbi:hypothetical protein Vsou_14900 [Vulcanisaeta souniana JCM 11219]|uniref:Uncharacterized protein n=2 Tax=Vulcanisaeta souniana TaxID=164452 RepID=A0A830E641_9CREN|nr:hypothetical protein Vsou_14900 [Vulcanisaeta souniana JCM 11219]GGI75255.1 hypothetical protein GCM10007112_10080 [Vulcanisaeta souniana JCM 11219]
MQCVVSGLVMGSGDVIRELRYREEARRIRRAEADWDFINSLPPRVRSAVVLFIETGDLRLAQRLSGLNLEDLVDILRRARVWIT